MKTSTPQASFRAITFLAFVASSILAAVMAAEETVHKTIAIEAEMGNA
jgi:hypothetical protein